jgi:alpha-glucosidase
VPNGPLTLRVYPGGNCRGTLYQDDGKSFAYERGGFLRMEFSCAQDGDQLILHVGRHVGSYAAWWKELRVQIYGATKPFESVMLSAGGSSVQSVYDSTDHFVSFTLADDGKGMDVRAKGTK